MILVPRSALTTHPIPKLLFLFSAITLGMTLIRVDVRSYRGHFGRVYGAGHPVTQ